MTFDQKNIPSCQYQRRRIFEFELLEGKTVSPAVKGKRRGWKIEVEGHVEDTCPHLRAEPPLEGYILFSIK